MKRKIRISDITKINAQSKSFNFLHTEPDIYSVQDIKKKYKKTKVR